MAVSSDQVKILCVNIKGSDSPAKIKSKILKGLRKAEKKTPLSQCVSQPLHSWTKDLHSITDIPASKIIKLSSNSRFIVWLLKDGTACRLKCVSTASPPRKERRSLDSALQRSTPSFQELSDAEFARQLHHQWQSEITSGRGTTADTRRV